MNSDSLVELYIKQYGSVMNGVPDRNKVNEILIRYNVDNECYAEWLLQTGGGPIGADWFDGINELENSNEKIKSEKWNLDGFCIGWDGSGNPIVLDSSGKIITKDHNFGGIHVYADSFSSCLRKGLRKGYVE